MFVRNFVAFMCLTMSLQASEPRFEFSDFTGNKLKATTPLIQLRNSAQMEMTQEGKQIHVSLNRLGNYLATGSDDGNITLWQLGTDLKWQKLTVLTANKQSTTAYQAGKITVALHPEFPTALAVGSIGIELPNTHSRVIWTLSEPKTQRFLDNGTANVGKITLKANEKNKEHFFGFAFSHDANFEAQVDGLRVLLTRKVPKGELSKEERTKLRQFWSYDGLNAIGMSWCGTELVILTKDKIYAWTPSNESTKPSFIFSSDSASGIASSACGSYVLAFGQGKTQKGASLYQRKNQLLAKLDEVHSESISAACFSPERDRAKIMLTAARNGQIRIWDTASASIISEIEVGHEIISLDCGSSSEGKYTVVAGTSNGKFFSYILEKK